MAGAPPVLTDVNVSSLSTQTSDRTALPRALKLLRDDAEAALTNRVWKDPVRVASAATIANLSSVTVADFDGTGQGVTLAKGDRVLVKNNASKDGIEGTAGKRQGIYVVGTVAVGAAPLTRDIDANTSAEMTSGVTVEVNEGTSAGGYFALTTANPITLDTTAQTWSASSPAALSSATPIAVGSAAPIAGVGVTVSRADHVHQVVYPAKGAALGNADATIQPASTGDVRTLPAATLTAAHALTLGTTSAVAGERVRIERLDMTAWTYAIINGGVGAGTLFTFPGNATGNAEFIFDGTNWALYYSPAKDSLHAAAGTAIADSSVTIQPTAGFIRKLAAATLTAARSTTIGVTGAAAGDVLFLVRLDLTGFAWTIINGGSGAGTLAVIPGGEPSSLALMFDGTDWSVLQVGQQYSSIVTGAALTDQAATTVQRGGRRTSFLLAGAMSQDETITLGTTGAQPGDEIEIIRTSTSAHTAAIANGGGGAGTLVTLPNSKVNFARARYDGTNWLFAACGTQ